MDQAFDTDGYEDHFDQSDRFEASEAFDEMLDWLEDENAADAAVPDVTELALLGAMPQASHLPRSIRRPLVGSVAHATRLLISQHGPQAARAIPQIIASVQRTAQRHRLPIHALPQAIRRITARVASSPSLVRRLEGVLQNVPDGLYLEETDEFARPAPLSPPGNCTQERHNVLQREVNQRCHGKTHGLPNERGGRTRACSDSMRGCNNLSQRIRLNVACANARNLINRECYEGGDEGHRKAARDAAAAAANCREIWLRRRECHRRPRGRRNIRRFDE